MRDRVDAVLAFDHVCRVIKELLDDGFFPFLFVLIVTRFSECFVQRDATAGPRFVSFFDSAA